MDADLLFRFLDGVAVTLQVAFAAYGGALVVGTIAASFRVIGLTPLAVAGKVYVEIAKNVPVLALLFLAVYGLPEIGLTFDLFWTAVVVLALYEGMVVCEALRSGINAVSRGNAEAGRALGLSNLQVLSRIVIPQASRSVVQPLGNAFIKTLLASSLVAVIGIVDMTGAVHRIYLSNAEPMLFIFAGVVYAAIALIIGQVTGLVERKVRFAR